MRRSLAIMVASLSPIACQGAVWADGAPTVKPEPERLKVLHLRLSGDLDCARLAADFAAARQEAAEAGTQMMILELSGNRWRPDVLLEMLRSLGSGGTGRLVVWLNDPGDGRVGTGQMAFGLAADACYLGPRTVVRHEPGDDLPGLMPAESDAGPVADALKGLAWRGLRDRGADPLLAAAVPCPRQPLWAVVENGSGAVRRVVATRPEANADERVVPVVLRAIEQEPACVAIDAPLARSLRLVDGAASQRGQILTAEGVRPLQTVHRELESGLAEARERLVAALEGVDRACERLDRDLDAAGRRRGSEFRTRNRRTGRECLEAAAAAGRGLARAEGLIGEYPELLREPPPGTTPVETTASRLSAAWHRAFQDRRDRVIELRDRADRFANPAD